MSKTIIKLSLAALLSLTLTACFHIQLTGSVGGGTLTIAPLRSPDTIVASATSWMPEKLLAIWGQEQWDEHTPLTRLIFTGITQPATDSLDPLALYLVTATGGQDFDPQGTKALSDSPVVVQGNWHTIASGQRIMDGNLKVSALTEALYRQLQPRLPEWSDAEVVARLNAAAQLVVGDADESGSVDYDDVLRWNRSLDGDFYLGDLTDVDALSAAVIAGQPASMISDRAEAVLGSHTVVLEFDSGTVTVETLNWDAPITVVNFLDYVNDGYYDQMMVHRAIDGFMVQMGWVEYLGLNDFGKIEWLLKTPSDPIVNESSNGLSNVRGTLSMARTNRPDSATAQFFINQANNSFLDHGSSGNPDGYAVFARVINGMTVVDDIAEEPTVSVSGIGSDVPARGVILNSATVQ